MTVNKKVKFYLILNLALLGVLALMFTLFFSDEQSIIINALNNKSRIVVSLDELEKSAKVNKTELAEQNQEKLAHNQTPESVEKQIEPKEPILEAAPNSVTVKKKYISVFIAELGLSRMSTENALSLPKEVSMGFSPYSYGLTEWFEKSRLKGHEIFLELPLEPQDYPIDNPGPLALLTSLNSNENLQKLENLKSISPYIKGFYSINMEKFTQDNSNLKLITDFLEKSKLPLIYNDINSRLSKNSNKYSCNLLCFADIILDDKIDKEKIENKLQEIKLLLNQQDHILIVARPYPISIKLIDQWMVSLSKEGFNFISVSDLLKLKELE